MHIPRGRRHWVNKKSLFCLFLFMFVFLYCIVFVFWTYILPYAIMLHWMHVRMSICFAMWSLVYDQVTLMFHIIFAWSQFTCYIILILLLLALPWGSNVLCKCFRLQVYMFQVHHSFSSFWREETLRTFSLYCLSLYLVFCGLYPCYFCKLLGFVSMYF